MTECLVLVKAGVRLGIIASFPDGTKIERTCSCKSCMAKPKLMRYRLLPCGCHGTIVQCDCRVHERYCNTCGRIFLATAPYTVAGKRHVDVYEVEDPHGENAKL